MSISRDKTKENSITMLNALYQHIGNINSRRLWRFYDRKFGIFYFYDYLCPRLVLIIGALDINRRWNGRARDMEWKVIALS